MLLRDAQLAKIAARCFEQLLAAVAAAADKPGKGAHERKQHELSALAHGLAPPADAGPAAGSGEGRAQAGEWVLAAMTQLAPSVRRAR